MLPLIKELVILLPFFKRELANILRNALLVIPKEQELIKWTMIPGMLIYNVFEGNTPSCTQSQSLAEFILKR